MPFIFNLQGAIASAIGLALGVAVAVFTKNGLLSLGVACVAASATDVWFRLHSFEDNRWLDSGSGASLYFVPVYILSVVAFVIGVLFSMNIL